MECGNKRWNSEGKKREFAGKRTLEMKIKNSKREVRVPPLCRPSAGSGLRWSWYSLAVQLRAQLQVLVGAALVPTPARCGPSGPRSPRGRGSWTASRAAAAAWCAGTR